MELTGGRASAGTGAWALILTGAGAVAYSVSDTPAAQLDLRFFFVTLLALYAGTRVLFGTTRGEARVTLADACAVFALLWFGGGAATLLTSAAALCASLRAGRTGLRAATDVAAAAVSLTAATLTLEFAFGTIAGLKEASDFVTLPAAVAVVALAQALATAAAVASGSRFAQVLPAHFATAAGAACAAQLAHVFGFYPLAAAATLAAAAHFAYSSYVRDIYASASQARRVEGHMANLRRSEELFRGAFDHAAIGMAMVSGRGRWLRVNDNLCEILGYSKQELLGKDFQSLTPEEDLGPALASVKKVLSGELPHFKAEKRYVHKEGHEVWVLWSVAKVQATGSGEARLIFQIQEITDRKRAEERLLHDAFHDPLTGLPNRALFIDHLKMTMARAKRRQDQVFAVLFLDLDRFKVINDSLGHMFGDQLLVGIARRLETCMRQGDTVARVGGDEFTILLEDIQDEAEAASVAERIQKELASSFNLSGHEVFTTASIGVAPSTTGYEHPEEIMRDADTAMYRAKSLGKARHEVFDKAMHAYAVNLLQLETDLRRALDRNEFFVQYQPIVDLDGFSLRGFEALVRWQHPERGLISPMDFIPIAEDTGQILAIGQWMLRESCRQLRRWQKQFPLDAPLFVGVNLSSKQFTQPDLMEQIRSALEETGLAPRCLKLEITESVVMENIETATAMLRELRALGVQLAIDDFGTGYSSLSYLHKFPIDTLKIDRSFVTRMVGNSENTEIVRTIIMLAQNLGMDVVAEGVETKEQLAQLRKLGCENGQGYFFSRPVSVGGAEKIIAETCAQQPHSTGARLEVVKDDAAAAPEESAHDSAPAAPVEPGPDSEVKSLRVLSVA